MSEPFFEVSFAPDSREGGSVGRGRYYYVVARSSEGSSASERIRFSAPRVVELEERVHAGEEVGGASAAEELGSFLFESFFRGSVRDLFFETYGRSRVEEEPLQIRLRFSELAPELAVFSWEYLYWTARRAFWTPSCDVSIVRHLELPEPIYLPKHGERQQFLMVTASPTNGTQVDVEEHERSLAGVLAPLQREGLIGWRRVPRVDQGLLAAALATGRVDVVHLVAHGEFDRSKGRGSLVLEDILGRGIRTGERNVGALLHARGTRLMVLVACQGAEGSSKSVFDGVAQKLVLEGVPVVVAMRTPVRQDHAIQLTEVFYSALARGASIDRALIAARSHLKGLHSTAWGIPALFSRSSERFSLNIPPHFGHPFKRQILAIEEALESDPRNAIVTVCETPLERRELGPGGSELLRIRDRLRVLRRDGEVLDTLELFRQLRCFLELLEACG